MATTAMDYENANGDRFEDDGPRYDRDRSPTPRRDEGHDSSRRRSASPNGNAPDRAVPKDDGGARDDGAVNPGSNLFVTGIHPKLTEEEISRLFEKYGEVEKCQIMRDPHSRESRGFGFVKMVTAEQADAARDGLQGEQIEGRTLSIEKARRARPRTPTPGKYFGPPKRDAPRRFGDRFDDRRRGGGYGGGFGGREDPYRYRGYREDRGYDRGGERGAFRDDRGGGPGGGSDRASYREDRGYDRRDRDDAYGRIDRYAGREERGGGREGREGREDREPYGPRGGREDRRGGAGYDRERYDRPSDRDGARARDGPGPAGSFGDSGGRGEAREAYGGSR